MKISREVLQKAVRERIISTQQADALLLFLKNQSELEPGFTLTNILYYLGGLLAIGAMSLFMTLGWESFGGWGIVCLSLIYAAIGLWLSSSFARKGHKIPAGICATFVITLTPLAIYGLQQAMGWWPATDTAYHDYHIYARWNWIMMELGTLLAGSIFLWFYRYPFMTLPIAVTLWYMSMDLSSLFAEDYASFSFRATVSMYFGLATLLLAFWVDLRSRHSADYAFWLYIFGVLAFWGGLTAQSSDSELAKFIYFSINLLLIAIGVILSRKVFVVFGALGCSFYLGHLTWQVFQNSVFFPIILTLIGLGVIYLGTLWQKHEKLLTKKAQAFLPQPVRELLQARSEN